MGAADELRRLSGSLHPVALEQSGRCRQLAALTRRCQDEYGIAAASDAPADGSSRTNTHDAAVYMIAREDGCDAARPEPQSVAIDLTQGHRSLRLRSNPGREDPTGRALLLHERAVADRRHARGGDQDPR